MRRLRKGVSGIKTKWGDIARNIPMEELGIRQSVGDFIADLVVICLYPNFLEANYVVVGPRERTSNRSYAFMAVFGNVLQTPGKCD